MRTRVWQGGMTSLVVRGRNWIMGYECGKCWKISKDWEWVGI